MRWLKRGGVLAMQAFAHLRPHAVGADQRDAALVDDLLAAPRQHGDAVDVGREVLDAHAERELDVLLVVGGVGERGLQVAAMQRPVGRAVACLDAAAERNARDLAARARRS